MLSAIEAAGKTYTFCECNSDCSAEEYWIRDQIVIGTTNENIREKAMIKNWNLAEGTGRTGRYHSGNNRDGDIPIKYLERSIVKQYPDIYRCKKRF